MILQSHVWVFTQGNKNTNYNIYWKDTWTPMCTAALFIIFIILKTQKQCTCPWMDKNYSLSLPMGVCVCVRTRTCACAHVCGQPCLTLYDPMDCSLPGSSVHGIFQPRILEWVAISNRDWTHFSCVYCDGRWILYHWVTWKTIYTHTHTPENISSIKNEISPFATRWMNFLRIILSEMSQKDEYHVISYHGN